jgi:CRP/FNR family transcriptional regulator, anaerobic regulatory protein
MLKDYLPFWNQLTPEERTLLESAAQLHSFKKGTVMHRGADDCTGLFLVTSGQLRAFTVSDEGRELTLYRLLDHDLCLFSAPCIMNSIQFDLFVEAEVDTTAYVIPPLIYKNLMDSSFAVAHYTNELMASRFSDVMWLIDQVMNRRLDSRLAALLIEEEQLVGSNALDITHEQLAKHLGSAREVVTRMLKYLHSEGLVELKRGHVNILDKQRLRKLAGNSLR